jgi:hypothetical protein
VGKLVQKLSQEEISHRLKLQKKISPLLEETFKVKFAFLSNWALQVQKTKESLCRIKIQFGLIQSLFLRYYCNHEET